MTLNYINQLLQLECFNDQELEKLSLLKNKFNSPYTILFKGEYSTGKSTIINHLLSRPILPYDEPEVNAIITILKYGDEEKGKVYYKNGNIKEISIEDSNKYINQKDIAEEALAISKVELYLKDKYLEDKQIIDTPGLNTVYYDHIEKTHKVDVLGDIVCYTVLGESGLKETPDFEELKKMKNKNKNFFIILTRIDDLGNVENVKRKISESQNKLKNWNMTNEIFTITTDDSNNKYSSVNDLSHLKRKINNTNNKKKTKNITNELKYILEQKIKELKNDKNHFDEIINDLENKVEEMVELKKIYIKDKERINKNFKNKTEHIIHQIEQQIENIIRTGDKNNNLANQIKTEYNCAIKNAIQNGRVRIDTIFEENIEKFYNMESTSEFSEINNIGDIKVSNLRLNTDINTPDNNLKIILNYLNQNKGDIINFFKFGFEKYIKQTNKKLEKDLAEKISKKLSKTDKNKIVKITNKHLKKMKIANKIIEGAISVGEIIVQIAGNIKQQKKIDAEKKKIRSQLQTIRDQLITALNKELQDYFDEAYKCIKDLYISEINDLQENNKISNEYEILEHIYNRL